MNQGKFEAVDVNIKKWLEDKLDEKNGWCAGSIKTQLTKEMIEDICQTFPMLRTQVKLKTLLAIFHLPRSRIQEWQTTLEHLLKIGLADDEQPVAFLAEILQPFVSTGTLFTDLENLDNQNNKIMVQKFCRDLNDEISLKTVSSAIKLNLLPVECYFVDRSVLANILPEQEPPKVHFRLKRKTKAQVNREDLMNKASFDRCATRKSRYSVAQVEEIPMRMKLNPTKISDTIKRKNPRGM